jgi:GNAT superfamily N-acetyltransferase
MNEEETTDFAGVRSFYRRVGYGGGAHPDDRLLVVREKQSMVAAVRLCVEEGTLVLRGMYVAEALRGRGIGSRLLASVSSAIGSSECWCIPYTHLLGFYSKVGFASCEAEASPPFLAERWREYTRGGQSVAIMRRPARFVGQ